jgi:hypothetical protein
MSKQLGGNADNMVHLGLDCSSLVPHTDNILTGCARTARWAMVEIIPLANRRLRGRFVSSHLNSRIVAERLARHIVLFTCRFRSEGVAITQQHLTCPPGKDIYWLAGDTSTVSSSQFACKSHEDLIRNFTDDKFISTAGAGVAEYGLTA